ncbi:MAG: DUF2231 domain-containing protein [Candidatus Marinimicrobia bacterium]|nr:DUF2231 domain-containing protein [Candidatus Neomarinimicrobiota bacterium]
MNRKSTDLTDIPLHPQIVHFPIVLITISFFFDLVGTVRDSKHWTDFGAVLLLLAVVFALAALLSGQSAEDLIKPMSEDLHDAVEEHEDLATFTFFYILLLGIARAWMQIKNKLNSWLRWGYVVLAGISFFLILRVGYLGGRLVYIHGAGVQQEAPMPIENE